MRTKYTSTASDGTAVIHYTHQGPGAPTSSTYESHEKHLFAFPALLVGDKLLDIAETRSNQQISDAFSNAHKTADGQLLSGAAVASRIKRALKVRANKTNKTLSEVQVDFAAVRKANGIKALAPGYTRKSAKGKSIVKTTSTLSVQGAVSESIEKQEDSSDSELSELESEDEQ
jgi:hypothetical protein